MMATSASSHPKAPAAGDPTSPRAVHTPNDPEVLRRLGSSLLVTTCQAGKVVMVRDEGDQPGEAWGKSERVEEWRR